MSALTTIARPYARAAFEFAKARKELKHWSDMMVLAATIASDALVKQAYGNPQISREGWAEIFADVGADDFDADYRNFLMLLAVNDRLPVIMDIATQYELMRAEEEKSVTVRVVSAIALTDDYRANLQKALSKRLGKEADLDCHVDESLLGGLVVQADDLVIDGTLKSKVQRLGVVLAE